MISRVAYIHIQLVVHVDQCDIEHNHIVSIEPSD
jgi:hypothetical protein